jgi:DNA-binding FadR family transcriptional regulator
MLRLDAISFDELAEVRHLLEVHSAIAAATRATPHHIAALEAAIANMEHARSAMPFVEADVAFHEELGRAAGNRVLIAFLESLRPLLLQGMLAGTRLPGARDVAVSEHTAILGAIRDHDESAVRELMEAHLERSSQEWREAERRSTPAGFER